jgi:AraC family transcriptional activator of mtrCDE
MAVDPSIAIDQPYHRPSAADLGRLFATLEVKVAWLSECLVSPGWRLELPPHEQLGIHYSLVGGGWLKVGSSPPIELRPHTLVVIPPNQRVTLGVSSTTPPGDAPNVVDCRQVSLTRPSGAPLDVRRRVAGTEPKLIVICGYFDAVFGATIDLFSGLTAPVVEQFDPSDQIDSTLRAALEELVAQEVGDGAMATALLKQVMVRLLRRSLNSTEAWVERFSILGDPQITRAFAGMVERPGAAHTVQSLAKEAGLSRTAFIDRFRRLFMKTPMVVLRDLRMREAARALVAGQTSLDQIAFDTGYQDRSGFLRAFRKVYGCEPAEFRSVTHKDDLFVGL